MTAIAKLSDRFTEADIDHEIVVMRLDTGEFFSLSGTAAVIWRLIDGQRDKARIVADAAREFDVSGSDCEGDVEEFLTSLREMGLLAG